MTTPRALRDTKQELNRLDRIIKSKLQWATNALASGQSWRTKGMKKQLKPLQERWNELDDFRQYLTYASKLDFANKYQQELNEGKLTEPCHL